MMQLYSNEDLCTQLIEKGKWQHQKFSWDNTARQLWEIVLEASSIK
jgi:hypothetical protein